MPTFIQKNINTVLQFSRLLVLGVSLASATSGVNAALFEDLPSDIQDCLSSSACTGFGAVGGAPVPGTNYVPNTVLGAMNNGFAQAYSYTDSGVSKFLMQYQLTSPSRHHLHTEQLSAPFADTVSSLSGNVWIEVEQFYDFSVLSEQSLFVYTDDNASGVDAFQVKISQSQLIAGGRKFRAEIPLFDAMFSPFSPDLPDWVGGALSDVGGATVSADDGFSPVFSAKASPSSPSLMQSCLADGCGVFMELDLAYLSYAMSGDFAVLSFDPSDDASVIFRYGNYFSQRPQSTVPYNFEYNAYLVSAVPVPAAVWLFSSGLIGMFGVSRLRNRR